MAVEIEDASSHVSISSFMIFPSTYRHVRLDFHGMNVMLGDDESSTPHNQSYPTSPHLHNTIVRLLFSFVTNMGTQNRLDFWMESW